MIDVLDRALAGRYRVETLVGRGGMATVYRAVDLRHDRAVAIKVMNPEFAESVGRDRFLREILVTAGFSHPHVLPLYDSGEVDGLLFYVMPFVEGVTLRQRLTADRRLPWSEVRKIAREAAEALAYAHGRGIVHRDIKPENILLAGYSAGDERSAWNTLVADFGISAPTMTRGENLTATGLAIGSPQYMSPEQAAGERVDQRSDIWALGCVVYEMLEGAPPRGVPAFKTPGVPAAAVRAVTRALAAEPAERFADTRDFATALDTASATRRWVKPASWAVSVVALVALAVTVPAIWHHPPAARPITTDSLALSSYNAGRANWASRDPNQVAESYSQLSRAIGRDSSFALAWAGLAMTAQFALLRGFVVPGVSRDSLTAMALAASQRAVMLDSSASEVWLARARVMETIDPTSRTTVLNDVRRALAADSSNGDAWFLLGRAREELLDSAGARVAYERAITLSPANLELLGFLGLHYLWAGQPAPGLVWADSGVAIDPTHVLAREDEVTLAIELHDWPLAERHLLALQRVARGADAVMPFAHAAWMASLRGDRAQARRLAAQGERTVDSTKLTKHQAVYLGEAWSSAGDTARALRWISAFTPRNDVHFQLHLHRDPWFVWLRDARYRSVLNASSESEAARRP